MMNNFVLNLFGSRAKLFGNKSMAIGAILLLIIVILGVAAPYLGTIDPNQINPSIRNKPVWFQATIGGQEFTYKMGTDRLGRDIYSRVMYGARVSLTVGVSVALISAVIGILLGVLAGYYRVLDNVIMRLVDGLMAIPSILLALALISMFHAGLVVVISAISIAEIPRVIRLVRSVVLSAREEPYVEASVASGTPTYLVVIRHILPNVYPPLIVQITYVAAHAILIEAVLSFLGVGITPEIPTWGNIMAEGRALFMLYPHNIFFPGVLLAVTILAINMFGDGLRDLFDPRAISRI